MRFRLVPKSTTFDDFEGHYALHFKTHASFGAHHENMNEYRPTLSAGRMWRNDFSSWQYKVYADIRGLEVPSRRENDSGVIENSIFRAFGRYVFGTLGNEANIISSFHELMQSRGVRRPSVCLSVRPSVSFAQIASSTTNRTGSPPNSHTMVPRWACIQGMLKVKVKVKGRVIRALLWCHEMFAIQYGLTFCLYMRSLYMKHHYTLLPA